VRRDVRNMDVFVVPLCPKMPYGLVNSRQKENIHVPLLRNDTTRLAVRINGVTFWYRTPYQSKPEGLYELPSLRSGIRLQSILASPKLKCKVHMYSKRVATVFCSPRSPTQTTSATWRAHPRHPPPEPVWQNGGTMYAAPPAEPVTRGHVGENAG
jgi:hypothetical protein